MQDTIPKTIIYMCVAGVCFFLGYRCFKNRIINSNAYDQVHKHKLSILGLKNDKQTQQTGISEALQLCKITKQSKRILIENIYPHFNGQQFYITTKTGSSKNDKFAEIVSKENFQFVGYDNPHLQKTPFLIQCFLKQAKISDRCLISKQKYVPDYQKGYAKILKRLSPLAVVGAIGISLDQTIQLKAQFIGNSLSDILRYYDDQEISLANSMFFYGFFGFIACSAGVLTLIFYFANRQQRRRY